MRRGICTGLALALILVAIGLAHAAGNATVTRRAETGWIIDWTADASGDATKTFTPEDGYVTRVLTMSDDEPTSNYDATLLDADGWDVLNGAGEDRPSTVPTSMAPLLGDGDTTRTARIWTAGPLTLVIDNAGANTSGRFTIYIERWRR